MTEKQSLLLVDDEPTNLRVLRTVLQEQYRLLFAKSGEEALQLLEKEHADLILLDVMMPGLTGFDVCARLKANPLTCAIPVIFVTALKDEMDETKGFEVGAVDYITKPISPAVVRARVKTHLSLVQAQELKQTRLQVIQRLGRAAEYKDNETGLHVMRMSHYAQVLALAYGFSEQKAEDLLHAAPMHDIGKIGIADSILLKPGKLTVEEYQEMQKHPLIGAEIIGDCESDLLKMAKAVALYHHEKWDGTGYPFGLSGEQIPIEARIVALSDVFDALTSARPYKQAWTIEATLQHIRAQKGLHFEPVLVDLLEQNLQQILEIKQRWAE
ncbi:response regulator [Rheinheimera tangshanensis]|jgi:putative two-component system response regulator|uniref:Response regulator n=1 Tax=Rheinheimera tangshanensis TaxID=400153 RepID=A0A5C8M480_9GAMM|nr:HD domain-containing phosphohydrolase [Rheinheimera tangshanensis]TXK82210.1 response regulator [Rheinheimera tangshanensis]GGM53016.1 two-component system response regulator [Rheinheimera tangshanensis]